MSLSFIRRLISNRLLRPVFIVLVVAGLVQLLVSQWLISSQIERLVDTAGSALEASSQIARTLTSLEDKASQFQV
ncbi:hypothetical protein SAMN04487881_1301 [Marinobacter sp. es.048]|uniref:hypothetical protein n=1 Tax=Marinobacter sp. es.048 TaxID=1761795 RepID=UPI000B593016|nr:hypothetical protein [Marinobacter sp. es.048]SNC65521.1 hypothetical protein SAMN04487881_1301 [Marinobacter sp. es.048]